MAHRSLRVAAASYALGSANTGNLVDAAHEALNDSVYSYSLGELATYQSPTWADAVSLFLAALEELGVVLPAKMEAISLFIEDHVLKLSEDTKSVGEILSDIRYICFSNSLETREELTRVFGVWREHAFSYEDEQEMILIAGDDSSAQTERMNELDRTYRTIAREWCVDHWQVEADPRWLTSTVVDLAQHIREERAFERLPLLADALMDAGCDHEYILEHLRVRNQHCKSCWLVDLLLNRK